MSRPCRGEVLKSRCFLGIVCFCLIIITATGCEPLRKKFTRNKKEHKQDDIIPLLEPLDYPARVHSSGEIYRHRYSLWQVWHKDLITAVKDMESDKSILYTLAQLIMQVDEMQKVVSGSTYDGLEAIRNELNKIKSDFQKPAGMRNKVIIENKLIRIDKKLRQDYSPRVIGDDLNEDGVKK